MPKNNHSIISQLYPDLEKRQERTKRLKKEGSSQNGLRKTMKKMFGDIEDDLLEIQAPGKIHNLQKKHDASIKQTNRRTEKPYEIRKAQNPENGLTYGQTIGLTNGLTDGETNGLTHGHTISETVSHSETGREILGANVGANYCETGCETVPDIHQNKLRFLMFVLSKKSAENTWRFTVKEAAEKLGMKYVTVRNYPKFCYDRGWMNYRTIKTAAWQGIEVKWMDRHLEDELHKNPISICETPCDTSSKKTKPVQGKISCETVSQLNTKNSLLDRQIEELSVCEEEKKIQELTENDLRLHFPKLSAIGFGVDQLEQILKNLKKVNKSTNRVLKGMEHAEFELANNSLQDAKGNDVLQPLGYIFNSLSKNGYYRKPKNFISQEELAAAEIEQSEAARIEAKQKQEDNEFKLWLETLTESEKQDLLKDRMGPEKTWLRYKWKNIFAREE